MMKFRQIPLNSGLTNLKRNPDVFSVLGDSSGGSFSAEAQAVLDRMPVTPSSEEQQKIATTVDALTGNGSSTIDSFFFLGLQDESNRVQDWFADRSATLVNTPTWINGKGYSLNGSTQYIDTGLGLLTLGGENYSQNDAYMCAFCYEAGTNDNARLFGRGNATGADAQLIQNPGNTRIRYAINTGSVSNFNTGITTFAAKKSYAIQREVSTTHRFLEDEVSISTGSRTSEAANDDGNVYLGCWNNGALGAGNFFDGSVSFWLAGASTADDYKNFLDTLRVQFSLNS